MLVCSFGQVCVAHATSSSLRIPSSAHPLFTHTHCSQFMSPLYPSHLIYSSHIPSPLPRCFTVHVGVHKSPHLSKPIFLKGADHVRYLLLLHHHHPPTALHLLLLLLLHRPPPLPSSALLSPPHHLTTSPTPLATPTPSLRPPYALPHTLPYTLPHAVPSTLPPTSPCIGRHVPTTPPPPPPPHRGPIYLEGLAARSRDHATSLGMSATRDSHLCQTASSASC